MTLPPRIALLLEDANDGGVERCIINLANGFSARGARVDVLNREHSGAYFGKLSSDVRVVDIATNPRTDVAVAAYCDRDKPDILLAAKDEDCELAVKAARRSEHAPRLFLTVSVNITAQLDGRNAGPIKRWRRYRDVRRIYSDTPDLVCVSAGVADDVASILGRDRKSLHVLPNPVVTSEHETLARQAVEHPWFSDADSPVILGVGRLGRIKNFALLVRAFARTRAQRECRLIILGEGKQRKMLVALGKKLGIDEWMDLPGFVDNPIAYMNQADLFVLSSRWEGFGNVLVEALACGTPAVSTNCPSGPSEILQNGRYGALVPIDDEIALSDAMVSSLKHPLEADILREAAAPFTLARSCDLYLKAFGYPGIATDST